MEKKHSAMMSQNRDILAIMEYIKGVLYFAITRPGKSLRSTKDAHFFSIDDQLLYENYYSDFGPLNLGCVYQYCNILNEKLKLYINSQIIVHYTSCDPKKKANSAFLIGCFGILYMNLTPKDALKPLVRNGQTFKPFQDATQGESMYTISLLNCLQAIKKAHELGFVNFQDFNIGEYEKWDKVQGGDLNWIVPDKFIAFIGPVKFNRKTVYHAPEDYLQYFLENNVRVVIRLNKRMYDSEVFTNMGIAHYDLYFPDGMCPPRQILFKFLQISETTEGALAVHCKAGLGRTGSLIGAYLIKHYGMTAREAIGWMRICRPGSVIGHQQAWLEQLEPWLTKQGILYRKQRYRDVNAIPEHKFGVYSLAKKAERKKPISYRIVIPHISSDESKIKVQKNIRSDLVLLTRPQTSKMSEIESQLSNTSKGKVCMKSSKTKGAHISTRSRGDSPESRQQFPEPKHNPQSNFDKGFGLYLKSAFKITPQEHSSRYKYADSGTSYNQSIPPSPFTSVFTSTAPMPYSKRKLGRSPSPSPTRSPVNVSRPPPAPPAHMQRTKHDNKHDENHLKEALSRLKLTKPPRDHSLGSYSADAQCKSPAPAGRFSSAKSDERARATQGDMLNSIKMQRRFLESLKKNS